MGRIYSRAIIQTVANITLFMHRLPDSKYRFESIPYQQLANAHLFADRLTTHDQKAAIGRDLFHHAVHAPMQWTSTLPHRKCSHCACQIWKKPDVPGQTGLPEAEMDGLLHHGWRHDRRRHRLSFLVEGCLLTSGPFLEKWRLIMASGTLLSPW